MLSVGRSNTLEPLAALVTGSDRPLRRSPRTTVSVKVSRRLLVAWLGPVMAPACTSGIDTCLPEMGSWMSRSVLVKRNWNVSASVALPVLSMWISYSPFGSMVK